LASTQQITVLFCKKLNKRVVVQSATPRVAQQQKSAMENHHALNRSQFEKSSEYTAIFGLYSPANGKSYLFWLHTG
jgi:ribose 1,5-bisphosphokinase PhnN